MNRDMREPKGGWKGGESTRECECGETYIGSNRSLQCAPCAYKPKVVKKKATKKKWARK